MVQVVPSCSIHNQRLIYLPYYNDGDFKLIQSGAILEYIADRHGMSELVWAVTGQIIQTDFCEAMDLRMSFVMTCYNPDFEKLKPGFLETLSQKLPNFGAYLGEKDWLTGDKINYPDFNLCELLNQLRKFEPSCLEMYPKLQSYLTRFEVDGWSACEWRMWVWVWVEISSTEINLPALREYMASKEFKTRPCNAPIAKWWAPFGAKIPFSCPRECTVMAPTLGYWDIRGLAEQSRLLLKYLGVEFHDKRYKCGPSPTFDRSAWLSEKYSLDLDFPNLPYYIDGDFKLTQSGAILQYIGDKHGMVPDCKKQRAVLHMLQCEVVDLRVAFVHTCYSPDFAKLTPKFLETLAEKLLNFETFLGEKEWLTGEKMGAFPPSIYFLCELLNQLAKFEPTCLAKYPKLQAYLSRFENLPALKNYMTSKEFNTISCHGPSAHWRGDH
ncbi:Glutathione S-transferase [Echinococcus granulosus]|uniref:glutathione transferase n=1 Tax=Echinococcus granulosus TaxID=6210 RepID=W6UII5_ECHGR|nr:Glutathione S-transferase [Echinococcus granulosus]EUB57912.1 Glutathione S-transferase [Echinococcus granulosus]